MLNTVGALLPLAAVIAISPVAIIGVILMLLGNGGRSTATGFMVGWLLGIVVAVTVFSLIGDHIDVGSGGFSARDGVHIALGVALLLLAARTWRKRPKPGDAPHPPKWMTELDKLNLGRAVALGFALAAINPKNLLMSVAAGLEIGGASLSVGAIVGCIAVFAAVAGSTVILVVVIALAMGTHADTWLGELRTELVAHSAAVVAALLLVVGLLELGKGIGRI
jgi:hypothetical protein